MFPPSWHILGLSCSSTYVINYFLSSSCIYKLTWAGRDEEAAQTSEGSIGYLGRHSLCVPDLQEDLPLADWALQAQSPLQFDHGVTTKSQTHCLPRQKDANVRWSCKKYWSLRWIDVFAGGSRLFIRKLVWKEGQINLLWREIKITNGKSSKKWEGWGAW